MGVRVAVGVAVAVGDGGKVAVGGTGVCVAGAGAVVGLDFPQPTTKVKSIITETIVIERADILDRCVTDSTKLEGV